MLQYFLNWLLMSLSSIFFTRIFKGIIVVCDKLLLKDDFIWHQLDQLFLQLEASIYKVIFLIFFPLIFPLHSVGGCILLFFLHLPDMGRGVAFSKCTPGRNALIILMANHPLLMRPCLPYINYTLKKKIKVLNYFSLIVNGY